MDNFISQLSVWAAPSLLAIVVWFVSKKLGDDKSIDETKKLMSVYKKDLDDKLDVKSDKIEDRINSIKDDVKMSSQLIIQVQSSVNKEILELNRANIEIKNGVSMMKAVIEESKVNYGKVIHLEGLVENHEKILQSSHKVLKQHNERLTLVEKKK